MKRFALSWPVVVAILFYVSAAYAGPGPARFYLAPDGLDSNPGTLEEPVATLSRAVRLAESQPAPAEVIVREGTYLVESTVTIPRSAKECRLVIRAAEGERAVFDGSIPLENARPLAGYPGVYAIAGEFPADEPLPVWEEESGRHFSKLAGLDAVRETDYSLVVLGREMMALRWRGGARPPDGALRMSRRMVYGLTILRDKVTLRDLEFRNFVSMRAASPVCIGGSMPGRGRERPGPFTTGTVIDSCRTWNNYFGFRVFLGSVGAVITGCRIENSVTGVWVSGIDTLVEGNEIVNDPDWSTEKLTWSRPGDRRGVSFYHGPEDATVRGNLVRGFRVGVFSKGSPGTYFIENNTVIYGRDDPEGAGGYALRPNMDERFHVRYNIFSGFRVPFGDAGVVPREADIDRNVFWSPEFAYPGGIRDFQERGAGRNLLFSDPDFAPNTRFADPLFADPAGGDYRLLPGSPALGVGERPAGAFPPVPGDYRGAPNLRLAPVLAEGALARDPLPPPGTLPDTSFLSNTRSVPVELAVSSVSRPVTIAWRFNDEPVRERDFRERETFELPDRDGRHTLRVRARDASGAWSRESSLDFLLARGGPRLLEGPAIHANRHGALFTFRTEGYAWGTLEYLDGDNWVEAADSRGMAENHNGFFQDYSAYWASSALPLLVTGLEPGVAHRYRLTVSDPVGSLSLEGEFTLEGEPRPIYVCRTGDDAAGDGTRARPYGSIQHALDRALPGDRVRIMPGIYFGSRILNHGGTVEAPLVIEGLYPDTVILDGRREVETCLLIDRAPHVVLRNLNLRWFNDAGFDINNSEGVRLTACRVINQYWTGNSPVTGTGARFWRSPGFRVDHSIFARLSNGGLNFDESSGGVIEHNTMTACAVMLIYWRQWWRPSEDITIRYNSLNWNGNQVLNIQQPLETLRERAVIDHNNYGTTFMRPAGTPRGAGAYGPSIARPFPYLPTSREFMVFSERNLADPDHEETGHLFADMDDWVAFSGQDRNSIFADPRWIDPRRGRFDVAADSPNLRLDGKIIGALGYLGPDPNTLPEAIIASPAGGRETRGAFDLVAHASDLDGKVARVSFYAGERMLGHVQDPPPVITLAGVSLPPGRHVLTVRATDDRGAETVSDPVVVTVAE